MAKVWLITGSGNGLGRDIAEAALAAGDSVVAGARRSECAGLAAGLRGLGRFDTQDVAKPRRALGRRSAKDRGRNSATGK